MDKWFHKQSKVLQVIFLLIPVLNWVIELCVRWSAFLRKGGVLRLVISIIVTVGGVFIGWLDAIWVLIKNRLILE